MKFTFHLLGLAHVPTSREYQPCAYTQKIVKLAKILREILGHRVIFYGTEGSEVSADELYTVGTRAERLACYGDYDWRSLQFKHDPKDSCHQAFNAAAIDCIRANSQERDFLLCPMGNYQQPIAQASGLPMVVEPGIGYTGTFSRYRVFESYAWMHYVYGLCNQPDGHYYDAVIPNYWDLADFAAPIPEKPMPYYLFVGRLISRKGLAIAVEVTEKLGAQLIVLGQGDLANVDGMDLRRPHVQHAGTTTDPHARASLMANAQALFCPTTYIGPFEGVHAEAMLCGCPVITSDWGVFTETVRPCVDGYRCRTFGEYVTAAQAAPHLDRAEIRSHARERFSLDTAASLYQDYFARLSDLWGKGWYTV
jgi:glycosyltransferase involved in cell wall biosynthesis